MPEPTSLYIHFECTGCQSSIAAKTRSAGKAINCPHCNSFVRVPEPIESIPVETEIVPSQLAEELPVISSTPMTPSTSNIYRRRRKRKSSSVVIGMVSFLIVSFVGVLAFLGSKAYERYLAEEETEKFLADQDKRLKPVYKEMEKQERAVELMELRKKLLDGMDNYYTLDELGFIVHFDSEARNVVVDHEMWSLLSTVEKARWVVTHKIGEQIERKTGSPRVTFI